MIVSSTKLQEIIRSELKRSKALNEKVSTFKLTTSVPKWGKTKSKDAIEVQKTLLAKAGIDLKDDKTVRAALGCGPGDECPDGYFGPKTAELWQRLGGGDLPTSVSAAKTAANSLRANDRVGKEYGAKPAQKDIKQPSPSIDIPATPDLAAQGMDVDVTDSNVDLMSGFYKESISRYVPLKSNGNLEMTLGQLDEVVQIFKSSLIAERTGWAINKKKFYRLLNLWKDKAPMTPKQENWLDQLYTDYNKEARRRLSRGKEEKFSSWESELIQAFIDAGYGKSSDPVYGSTVPKLKRVTPVAQDAKFGLKGTTGTQAASLYRGTGPWYKDKTAVRFLQGVMAKKATMSPSTMLNRLGCKSASNCPDGIWGRRTQGTWDEITSSASLPSNFEQALLIVKNAPAKSLKPKPYPAMTRTSAAQPAKTDGVNIDVVLTDKEEPEATDKIPTHKIEATDRVWVKPPGYKSWKTIIDMKELGTLGNHSGAPSFEEAFEEVSAIRNTANKLFVIGLLNSTGKDFLDSHNIDYDESGWVSYEDLHAMLKPSEEAKGLDANTLKWTSSDAERFGVGTSWADIEEAWQKSQEKEEEKE